MRVLYGIAGEGMGHAIRSRVLIEHLLRQRHRVRIAASGSSVLAYLRESLGAQEGVDIIPIRGLTLSYRDNRVLVGATLLRNFIGLPGTLLHNARAIYQTLRDGFRPDVVVSDFETWSCFVGHILGAPIIGIDNNHALDRCALEAGAGRDLYFHLARLAVKLRQPGAHHYLVPSFFSPPLRRKRTTVVAPILRPEILAACREPAEHLLVYQTAPGNERLLGALQQLPCESRVYGMGGTGRIGRVLFRAFSQQGFLEDLRTARAIVAGGGFSLMCEALHLKIPMLSIPVAVQPEQRVNAYYLGALGLGAVAERSDADVLQGFLANLPRYEEALAQAPAWNNRSATACLDELLRRIAA